MQRTSNRSRGAILPEYALGIALVVVVALGAIEGLTDSGGERLDERGSAIGAPGDEALGGAAGGGGSGPDGDDGEVPPPPPPAPYNGAVAFGGCTGSPDQNNCSFSLSLDPAPDVPVWTVNPSNNVTGSGSLGPTAALVFGKQGTYSVRATVGITTVQFELSCSKNNGNITCVAA
jgi:hypothetical protein